ncbi:MAG: dihydropteroate synthase [Candidatus Omnitrophica bacterium]|nr:dihydropteroate synthase [Candidatus Omnitrophota bacterium]
MPNSVPRKAYTLHAGGYQLQLGAQTKIMGILNLTPDSFSGDGLLKNNRDLHDRAVRQAHKLIQDGADILDIGGESTRPGAKQISANEEIARVIPTISCLAKKIKIPISIDTYKPQVAQKALEAGATIVNNIMGTNPQTKLLKMVKNYDATIVLMHIKGTPRTMQKNIFYKNCVQEIVETLQKSLEKCLEIGIKKDRIIIDPGIGFGKTVEHNLEILNRLQAFKILHQPLLIGTSRKAFIGKILNKDTSDRLIGTIASVCAGIINGAHLVRIHDVAALKEAITVTDAIINEGRFLTTL